MAPMPWDGVPCRRWVRRCVPGTMHGGATSVRSLAGGRCALGLGLRLLGRRRTVITRAERENRWTH